MDQDSSLKPLLIVLSVATNMERHGIMVTRDGHECSGVLNQYCLESSTEGRMCDSRIPPFWVFFFRTSCGAPDGGSGEVATAVAVIWEYPVYLGSFTKSTTPYCIINIYEILLPEGYCECEVLRVT